MVARRILVDMAEHHGAKKPHTFQQCVQFLDDNRHLTAPMREMADQIRDNGNEANHEPQSVDEPMAKQSVALVETLLVNAFELRPMLPVTAK